MHVGALSCCCLSDDGTKPKARIFMSIEKGPPTPESPLSEPFPVHWAVAAAQTRASLTMPRFGHGGGGNSARFRNATPLHHHVYVSHGTTCAVCSTTDPRLIF